MIVAIYVEPFQRNKTIARGFFSKGAINSKVLFWSKCGIWTICRMRMFYFFGRTRVWITFVAFAVGFFGRCFFTGIILGKVDRSIWLPWNGWASMLCPRFGTGSRLAGRGTRTTLMENRRWERMDVVSGSFLALVSSNRSASWTGGGGGMIGFVDSWLTLEDWSISNVASLSYPGCTRAVLFRASWREWVNRFECALGSRGRASVSIADTLPSASNIDRSRFSDRTDALSAWSLEVWGRW